MMRQLVVVLTFGLSLVVAPAAQAVERIAIVVGANRAPEGRRELRYAERDAQALGDVLEQVGEFAPGDVHVLLGPTPDDVTSALEAALVRLATAPESMLLFYYSGHADSGRLYPGGQALELELLRTYLDDPRATVRLGIIDSCRGGDWTRTKGLREVETFDVSQALALNNEGSVLIASSSGDEEAHESEELEGSFFTHYLDAALRGAGDENHDAQISLLEAFEYAKVRTIRETARRGVTPQHPSFAMNLRGRQDLLLANVASGSSFLSLAQNHGPLEVVDLATGVVLVTLEPGERQVRLAVRPGRYLVRRRDGEGAYSKEYVVGKDAVTQVEEEQLELVGSLPTPATPEFRRFTTEYLVMVNAGASSGLTLAFNETAVGRVALGNFMGHMRFAAITNLGPEISLPGRIAYRWGRDSRVEWVPWIGVPWYFTEDADGRTYFSAGVGTGVDAWLKLGRGSRVGLNLGLTSLNITGATGQPAPDDFLRSWAAVGYQFRLGDDLSFNLGLGYARTILYDGRFGADVSAANAEGQVALGSIASDGVHELPLIGYRLAPALTLGALGQIAVQPSDGSVTYQLSLGTVIKLGKMTTVYEK